MKKVIISLAVITVITSAIFFFQKKDTPPVSNDSSLTNEGINLILADTEEKRDLGLGGRSSLPEDTAMLFTFDQPDLYGIWMKDMLFPIDIVWLDENYEVINIQKNTATSTYPEVFYPTKNSSYVLEGNSGFCEKNDIFVGKKLLFVKNHIQK